MLFLFFLLLTLSRGFAFRSHVSQVVDQLNCECLFRQCSHCSFASDPLLTNEVAHVKALRGGVTSQLGGASAWVIQFVDGTSVVAKFKAVDTSLVVAAGVAHMIGVATPRVWFTPKELIHPGQVVDKLAKVASIDREGRFNAAALMQKIFTSRFDWVDGILLQDFFDVHSHNEFVSVLGLSGVPQYIMMGRMIVLDMLEDKSDAFNDIGAVPGAIEGLPGPSEEIRENNVANLLISTTGSVVDIDLGVFATSQFKEITRQALRDLIEVEGLLRTLSPGEIDNTRFPRGRIRFIQREVETLLCIKRGEYRTRTGGCGADDFAVKPRAAIEMQLGMVEAWLSIANKYEMIFQAITSTLTKRPQALENLGVFRDEAHSTDLRELLRVYKEAANLPEDAYYKEKKRCCVLQCSRYEPRADGRGWDGDKTVHCYKDNQRYHSHAFEMYVPEHKTCAATHAPLPGGYDYCEEQCRHVNKGGYAGIANRYMRDGSWNSCIGKADRTRFVPTREWRNL